MDGLKPVPFKALLREIVTVLDVWSQRLKPGERLRFIGTAEAVPYRSCWVGRKATAGPLRFSRSGFCFERLVKRIIEAMLRRAFILLLACVFVAGAGAEKRRKPVPAMDAASYSLHDTHARVTIAAEPCDTKDTIPHTRLDYYGHGFLPVRVIVTNDSDGPVNLDDARIHFIAADGTSIPAATYDDLQRGLFTIKSATGTKLPLGLPFPVTVGKKNIAKEIAADDNDFGFQTTTVAPHTTVAGYLYYDMNNVEQPVLRAATLELRKVRFAADNAVIDSFEISLTPASDKDGKQ
jgi:hypothetical protein